MAAAEAEKVELEVGAGSASPRRRASVDADPGELRLAGRPAYEIWLRRRVEVTDGAGDGSDRDAVADRGQR